MRVDRKHVLMLSPLATEENVARPRSELLASDVLDARPFGTNRDDPDRSFEAGPDHLNLITDLKPKRVAPRLGFKDVIECDCDAGSSELGMCNAKPPNAMVDGKWTEFHGVSLYRPRAARAALISSDIPSRQNLFMSVFITRRISASRALTGALPSVSSALRSLIVCRRNRKASSSSLSL